MINIDKIKKGDVLGIGSKFSKKANDYIPTKYTVYKVIDMDQYPNVKKQGVTHMFHVLSPKKKERELTIFKGKNFYYVMDVSGKTIIQGKLDMIKNIEASASTKATSFIEVIASKDKVLAKKVSKVLATDDFDVSSNAGEKLIKDIKWFIVNSKQFADAHEKLNPNLLKLSKNITSSTKTSLKYIEAFVELVKKMM